MKELTMHKKIGFLLSAGGSACFEGIALSKQDRDCIVILSERECGATRQSRKLGFETIVVANSDRQKLSENLLKVALDCGVDCIVMLFSRLVTEPLLSGLLTLNVHPSLLPSFAGLDGIAPAAKAHIPLQGASLHIADEGMDTGPILAQAFCAIPNNADLNSRHSVAFALKSSIVALTIDWWRNGIFSDQDRNNIIHRLPKPSAYNQIFSPGFIDKELEARCASLVGTRFETLSR